MKRKISLLCAAVFVLLSLSSCGPDYRFQATYPEGYTATYFSQQYVQADPNLVHLYASENDAGQYELNGRYWQYYTIKDTPVEEYVCYSEDFWMLDPGFSSYVARNKDMEMTDSEILSYKMSGAELYWYDPSPFKDGSHKMEALGEKICYEIVDHIDAAAFQTHLRTCVDEKNYVTIQNAIGYIRKEFVNDEGVKSTLSLKIRVHFTDYENIVWDGYVVMQDGVYYVNYPLFTVTDTFPEGYYKNVYVPLDESVSQVIAAMGEQD